MHYSVEMEDRSYFDAETISKLVERVTNYYAQDLYFNEISRPIVASLAWHTKHGDYEFTKRGIQIFANHLKEALDEAVSNIAAENQYLREVSSLDGRL